MALSACKDYLAMLRDTDRNGFYWRALQGVRGRRLLDLGAGTGLLSLLAARRGARVVAVEEDPKMAQLVRESARHNGLERRPKASLSDGSRWRTCVFFMVLQAKRRSKGRFQLVFGARRRPSRCSQATAAA